MLADNVGFSLFWMEFCEECWEEGMLWRMMGWAVCWVVCFVEPHNEQYVVFGGMLRSQQIAQHTSQESAQQNMRYNTTRLTCCKPCCVEQFVGQNAAQHFGLSSLLGVIL